MKRDELSPDEKEAIKRQYNYVCQVCENKIPSSKLTIHHIQAKRYHLLTSKDFLMPLCLDCHHKVEKDYRKAEKSIKRFMKLLKESEENEE